MAVLMDVEGDSVQLLRFALRGLGDIDATWDGIIVKKLLESRGLAGTSTSPVDAAPPSVSQVNRGSLAVGLVNAVGTTGPVSPAVIPTSSTRASCSPAASTPTAPGHTGHVYISGSWDMFLSHDWGAGPDYTNHARVKRVAEALQARGLRVWLDEEEMPTGAFRSQMARGITNSTLFIVFVTSNYQTKVTGPDAARDNCKYEFDYGFDLRGQNLTIPVVMEAVMKDQRLWIDSLGAALRGLIYVDLTSDDPAEFAQGIDRLSAKASILLSPQTSAQANSANSPLSTSVVNP